MDFGRFASSRTYDYLLGGGHNFAVDRRRAGELEAQVPGIAEIARANRAFLGRVVRRCAQDGVDQFLDLGCGVPTVGNVHEIARTVLPAARVAYVDVDDVVVAHTAEIFSDVEGVTTTCADLRDVDAVLHAPGVAELLDPTRPVAVIANAVLSFVAGDVTTAVAGYRDALVAGSVLSFGHACADVEDAEALTRLRRLTAAFNDTDHEILLRPREELTALVAGLDVVPPGIVDITQWPEPDPTVAPVGFLGALARVP